MRHWYFVIHIREGDYSDVVTQIGPFDSRESAEKVTEKFQFDRIAFWSVEE